MKKFSMPSLRTDTQAFLSCVFNKKTYNFVFTLCEDFVLADMYFLDNGENIYVFRGVPLVPEVDLIRRVKNPDIIKGSLYVKHKYGNDVDITQDSFDSEFELVYYDENELSEEVD